MTTSEGTNNLNSGSGIDPQIPPYPDPDTYCGHFLARWDDPMGGWVPYDPGIEGFEWNRCKNGCNPCVIYPLMESEVPEPPFQDIIQWFDCSRCGCEGSGYGSGGGSGSGRGCNNVGSV